MAVYESVLELVGETPIIDISQLSPNPSVRILAKLESQNPGGSVKDRPALRMMQDADVVVHDALLGEGILDCVRRDADRIDVGKRKGKHSVK